MKYLLLLLSCCTICMLSSDEGVLPPESFECEENEKASPKFKFRRLPTYENSVVRDPIERTPAYSYPSSYESSFYEQLTR